jgi:diguanylate cyclase (GGDEF)-like protein
MKIVRGIGPPDIRKEPRTRTASPRGVVRRDAVATAPLRLQQTLGHVDELRRALTSTQMELLIAERQADALAVANAQLKVLATRLKQDVAKARRFAYNDELTGLPNRYLLMDRLNQALARARRRNSQLALLYLDLDRFKDINDSLGHPAGDKLLQSVAERLLSCIRGGDTACRYGGDEFVVLLPEVEDEHHALEVAQKIRLRLAKPYMLDKYPTGMTASIGVAVYPVDGMSQNDLIKQADVAMYRDKTQQGATAVPLRLAATD